MWSSLQSELSAAQCERMETAVAVQRRVHQANIARTKEATEQTTAKAISEGVKVRTPRTHERGWMLSHRAWEVFTASFDAR